jgi:hypothetical protein
LEYLTIDSDIRVVIRGFTKQADADKAKFSLLRRDTQKKILDNTSAKVNKGSKLDPFIWETTVDEDLVKAALTKDEMQCEMYVSITAGGKTWSPPAQAYILYRNKITLAAKNDKNANLPDAQCTCTIRPPDDYQPKSPVNANNAQSLVNPGAGGGRWAPDPRTVVTGKDGTVELPLDAPGELDLEWAYPYYPKDQAAWLAQKGEKRETVLLERARKARFIWPDVSKGAKQKHYVNLTPLPASNRGRKLKIVVGVDRAVAGDKIYLTVELASDDKKDLDGKPLKCDVGGDLEVGKPKKTLTFELEADDGPRTVELDFNGWGGITAKLAVSTVQGSSDEKVEVTSWRKVDVQPYHPVPGFFDGDTFPDTLAKKVKAAFDPVFIEVGFLDSILLSDAFDGIEVDGKFGIVQISSQHAQEIDLDPGARAGGAALVFYKLGASVAPTPAHWIKRLKKLSPDEQYAGVFRSNPQTALHVAFAHRYYTMRQVTVSLTIGAGKSVSAPQTTTIMLKPHNIDASENPDGDLVLPWSSSDPSYWQVESDEDSWGEVDMDFVEVDREKAKQGIYQYTLKLPDGADGDPKALAARGKNIDLYVKLRGYEFGVAGEGLYPVIYAGLPTDYASARAAYTVIHEVAHALGFAPSKGEFYYSLAGQHCAYGMKSDAESYVRDNKGTVGQTVGVTITNGVTGKDIPLELVTQGKFGKCVMWGQTHRQKTTEDMFKAALKFCDSCAPLMRVTPIGAKIGGEA